MKNTNNINTNNLFEDNQKYSLNTTSILFLAVLCGTFFRFGYQFRSRIYTITPSKEVPNTWEICVKNWHWPNERINNINYRKLERAAKDIEKEVKKYKKEVLAKEAKDRAETLRIVSQY